MDLPNHLVKCQLWERLKIREDYVHAMGEIRKVALLLGSQVEKTIPEFTDHSVKHMDALWSVTNQILSTPEFEQVTPAEAFILGASFYVHDLGMALASTPAGVAEVRLSEPYKVAYKRLLKEFNVAAGKADILSIRLATRDLHAQTALDFVMKPLPGLGRYIIEESELRDRWAYMIGQVAASHHWNLDRVHRDLGVRNVSPTADGDSVDLGFLACVLRIVDYAHINRDRAPSLERAFRSDLSSESILHWDAQGNITGPQRADNNLVYGCTGPIQHVDAWWLFYDLASGLDNEIRSVREYLRGRAVSASRFSLQGVKGVELPESFQKFVQLAGDTSPIDVRVQPHSMERLVELLGGPHLYGSDRLAPVRELIQNARDAIELRNAIELAEGREPTQGRVTVSLEEESGEPVLSVRDNGVGMTRSVVLRHLIGVGSDFWHSPEFYRDFGKAIDRGFRPIGKFGIGFLSVFMLGNRIEVTSQSAGNPGVVLRLRGLGRRGELQETPISSELGTRVKVFLNPDVCPILENLSAVVRARAPMLRIPIVVRQERGGTPSIERIEPGWWKHVDEKVLLEFVETWGLKATGTAKNEERWIYDATHPPLGGGKFSLSGWPGLKPHFINDRGRFISTAGETRRGVIRCAQGIAVDFQMTRDALGLIDCEQLPLTVSRDSTIELATDRPLYHDLEEEIALALKPDIIAKLNEFERYGLIPARLKFFRALAQIYGEDVLTRTNLRWIPMIEPPGNLVHHSKAEFVERVAQQERTIVACGVGLGSAYGGVRGFVAEEELGRMLMTAIPIEEIDVGYSDQTQLKHAGKSNPLSGSLADITGQLKTTKPKLILTDIFVDLVAEAWKVPAEALRGQGWYLDYESNAVWADLQRDVAKRYAAGLHHGVPKT